MTTNTDREALGQIIQTHGDTCYDCARYDGCSFTVLPDVILHSRWLADRDARIAKEAVDQERLPDVAARVAVFATENAWTNHRCAECDYKIIKARLVDADLLDPDDSPLKAQSLISFIQDLCTEHAAYNRGLAAARAAEQSRRDVEALIFGRHESDDD